MMERGDYYGLLVTRTDGTSYIAYFRVMERPNSYGMTVLKDDTGAVVSMQHALTQLMFRIKPEDCPFAIDLDDFRPTDA